MDTLVKSDIFFFVTTIVVIILALIMAVILFYAVRLIRHVEHIAEKIKDQSDHVSDDIEILRTKFREGGMKFGSLFGMAAKFATSNFGAGLLDAFKKKAGTKRSTRKKQADESEE